MSAIRAEAAVPAPREDVFDFLARLENHWQLADRWIEVVTLEARPGDGGLHDRAMVEVRGPLGISRQLRTRVVGAERPERLQGVAEAGRGTRARITWSLAADGPGATRVVLEASIEAMSRVDRALWKLGGRLWMRRRFAAVVEGLAHSLARAAAPAGSQTLR